MPPGEALDTALDAEQSALAKRMLARLNEARLLLRRRLLDLPDGSDAASVVTAMLGAVDEAAEGLQGHWNGHLTTSRRRTVDLGLGYARATLPETAAGIGFRLPKALLDTMARRATPVITGYAEEFREEVGRQVQVGMLSGAPIDEIARNVGLTVKEPAGPFRTAAARCRFIAANETQAVANEAIWARYQDAAARIEGLQKEWVTAGDGRVRPSHFPLDGVTIPMDDDFDVNGHPAAHPHDPRLPMSERARCRCRLVSVVPEVRD